MAAENRKQRAEKERAQAERHRITRRAHGTEIAEDYVEVISDLLRDHGEARAVDIARRLGVTHVTVTKTVARLQRDGLVTTEPYRAIFLTEKGTKMADRCRKRHEIVLELLRAIGVPAKIAEADAEGIEHHVSEETLRAFQRLTKSLGKK